MNKTIMAVALLSVAFATAQASPGDDGCVGNCGDNNGNPGGNSTTNSGDNSNSSVNSNAARALAGASAGANSNAASNSTSTGLGIGLAGDSNSDANATSGNVSNSTTVEGTDFDDYVASTNHISPEPTAPCVVTGGAHFGVPGFIGGASGGIIDKKCEMREAVRIGLAGDATSKRMANEVIQNDLQGYLDEANEEKAVNAYQTPPASDSVASESNVWAFQNLGG